MDHEKLIELATQVPPVTPFVNQKIEGIIKDIQSIYSFWNITIGSEEVIHKESGSYKYEVIFKLADFLDDYIFVGRAAYYIRDCPYKFTFDTFLVNSDFTPVCIQNPNTKFLTRRHILKLNSLLRFGSFSVDDIGLIKFHLLWNYETNTHLAMKNKEDIAKWMKISLATTMSTLKVNMTKLLIMTELIDREKYASVISAQGTSIRQLPKFFHDDQEKLKNIVLDGITKKVAGNKDPVKTDELPKYVDPFYQRVEVKTVNYHGRLTVGEHSATHVVKAIMELEEQNKSIFKDEYFLVKVPRQASGNKIPDKEYVMDIVEGRHKEPDNRINVERRVISYPKDKCFQHVARYYDDWTDEYQTPMPYMENYIPQNLNEFNGRKDLSMSTKLSWLYQLAHVLVYFEKNKIDHIDKSSNIAVKVNLFLKIIETNMSFGSPGYFTEKESGIFSFVDQLVEGKLIASFKKRPENKYQQNCMKKTGKLLPLVNGPDLQESQDLVQALRYVNVLWSTIDPARQLPLDILIKVIKEYALFSEKLF